MFNVVKFLTLTALATSSTSSNMFVQLTQMLLGFLMQTTSRVASAFGKRVSTIPTTEASVWVWTLLLLGRKFNNWIHGNYGTNETKLMHNKVIQDPEPKADYFHSQFLFKFVSIRMLRLKFLKLLQHILTTCHSLTKNVTFWPLLFL